MGREEHFQWNWLGMVRARLLGLRVEWFHPFSLTASLGNGRTQSIPRDSSLDHRIPIPHKESWTSREAQGNQGPCATMSEGKISFSTVISNRTVLCNDLGQNRRTQLNFYKTLRTRGQNVIIIIRIKISPDWWDLELSWLSSIGFKLI